MVRPKSLESQFSYVMPEQAPDWESARYLNFAGRTVKHSDIVNMTNMDVARNGSMLAFAKIAGPILSAIPIPATKLIGMATTAVSYGYDTVKLISRMRENKSNDAFWSEYNEAVKSVQAQSDTERIATDFAIGSNLVSGQSLPSNVKPIGEIAGGLGQMAQYVALGVLGGIKTFIFGGAISNALNEANTRMGYGEEQGAAIRAGIARGIASGVTAAAFLSLAPALVSRLGGKMIDSEIATGLVTHPATNAVLRGGEFAGWGAVEPYALNTARYVAGLEPENNESSPWVTGGMFALGAMLSGGLLKKSYSFHRPVRMKSTGDKEYLNFAEMAAAKKSALKAVNDTVGVRYFGDITTPERQAELMKIAMGKKKFANPNAPTYEEVADFSGNLKLDRTIEERILEAHGVSKKLTTPSALEKVGGPEAALRLTTNDEQVIESAMSELSTARRLIKQQADYEVASRGFAVSRMGLAEIKDIFVADMNGIARKVRIADIPKLDNMFVAGAGKLPTRTVVDNIATMESFMPEKYVSSGKTYRWNQGAKNTMAGLSFSDRKQVSTMIESMIDAGTLKKQNIDVNAVRQAMRKAGLLKDIPEEIKKSVGAGSVGIISGLMYVNFGDDDWDIRETQWLTPAVASRLAEMARNEYRISRDRQASITKAMNVLPDDYALNPDNYKMVYDRFMKLTGGYA